MSNYPMGVLTASAERPEPRRRQEEQPERRPRQEQPEQPSPQQARQARQQQERQAPRSCRSRPEESRQVRCWRLPASRRPSASAPQRVR